MLDQSAPPPKSHAPPADQWRRLRCPCFLAADFQDRSWTDTDVGYLSFFAAMHAAALVLGPLTFSWDALKASAVV